MPLSPDTIIDDRYTVEALLGEGAMAEVYRVHHTKLGTTHALKVLKLEGDSMVDRFLREGQFQAKLNHPNIVSVTDIVKVGEDPGLVMEFVDGSSLDTLLDQKRLNFEQVDFLARGIIAGVGAAHEQGLIHRDLKPANILLHLEGKRLVPKVTDFGLAKALDAATSWNSTKSGVMMGTPAYMAPEQILDAKRVDARADVFSIGALLFHMVCGQRPFNHRTVADTLAAVMDGQRPAVRDLAPDVPANVVRAIDAALETDREKRVPNCKELLALWTNQAQHHSLQEHVPFDSEVFKRLSEAGQGTPLMPLHDAATLPSTGDAIDPNAQTLVHTDEPTEELAGSLAKAAPPPASPKPAAAAPIAAEPATVIHEEAEQPSGSRLHLIIGFTLLVGLILVLSLVFGALTGMVTALLLS